jgi:hypothetical protein
LPPPPPPPKPHDIEALELEGVRALLRAERLRLVSGAAACRYRCFFTWLLRVLRLLDAQGGCAAGRARRFFRLLRPRLRLRSCADAA